MNDCACVFEQGLDPHWYVARITRPDAEDCLRNVNEVNGGGGHFFSEYNYCTPKFSSAIQTNSVIQGTIKKKNISSEKDFILMD